jgi:hypothetical protein
LHEFISTTDPVRIEDADWGGLISPRARRRRHDAHRAAA